MRLPRQILLTSLLLAVAQTATAERLTAFCDIKQELGSYTYTAVASALWTVGTLNPTCEAPYTCDFVSDYLFGRVDIEGTQTGRITDTFTGWIENPLLFCFAVIPCGH